MNNQTLETLCKEYNPDKDYNGNYGHYLAEQITEKNEQEELEKRAELENYFSFIREIKEYKINVENRFKDRHEKEKLIKKYFNYNRLNGFNSLAECPDYAIGKAFENSYNSIMKKIKE